MKDPKPYTINGVSGHRWDCDTNEEWRIERSKSIGASAIGILITTYRPAKVLPLHVFFLSIQEAGCIFFFS